VKPLDMRDDRSFAQIVDDGDAPPDPRMREAGFCGAYFRRCSDGRIVVCDRPEHTSLTAHGWGTR
jgi:hypothetical protein